MTTIYIPLLEEAVDVLRPTQGIQRDENQYEVLPTDDYDPEDEVWKFPPGSIVRCVTEVRGDEEILVANELI